MVIQIFVYFIPTVVDSVQIQLNGNISNNATFQG